MRLAGVDPIDEDFGALRNQGFFGDYQRLGVFAQDQPRASEHAGPQRAIGIGELSAGQKRASVGIDLGINRRQFRLECLARHAVECQQNRHAGLDSTEVALGQSHIDLHGGNVFDDREVGAILDEITRAEIAQAHHTVEGRTDITPGKLGLGQFELGLLHFQIGGSLILGAGRYEIALREFGGPVEIRPGQRQFGAGLLGLGRRER